MEKTVFALLLVASLMFVHAENEPVEKKENEDDDPKKTLESLGTFFKMMSGNNGSCGKVCPEGSVPRARPGHIPSSNGCGSMGIKLDVNMFPGFASCCDTHDICYDTCNSDRDKCDSEFRDCLDKVCTLVKLTQSRERVALCENAGGVMQAAAAGLGCSPFNQSQKRACICSGDAIEEDREDNQEEDEEEEEDDAVVDETEAQDDEMDRVEL